MTFVKLRVEFDLVSWFMDEERKIQEDRWKFNGPLRTGFHWCNFKRRESGIEGTSEPHPQLSDRLARLAQSEKGMRDE